MTLQRKALNPIMRGFILLILTFFAFTAIASRAVIVSPAGLEGLWKIAKLANLYYKTLSTIDVTHVLSAILVLYILNRFLMRETHPFSLSACIVSCIFALFRMLGISFGLDNSFAYLSANNYQRFIAFIVFLGYWVILYTLIKVFFEWLNKLKPRKKEYAGALAWINDHFFAVCMVSMLVFWGLFWILYFPGSLPHDGQNQLEQYFGPRAFSNHHPYLSTLLMGAIIDLGKRIAGYQCGIALYVAFQGILSAVVFSAICHYTRKKGAPLGLALSFLLFFTVVPLWVVNAQAVHKDTIFVAFFAWFALEYVKYFLNDRDKFSLLRLILTAVLVCVFRNNGIYIVVPALLVLLFIAVGKKRAISIALVAVCASYFLLTGVVKNSLGIVDGSVREALSIPFQQTARYVVKHGSELSEEEKQIIDAVIPYDKIVEQYFPQSSDPIKNMHRNPTEQQFKEYFSLWLKLFTRHPVTYIEATMNHVFGYIDPLYFYTVYTGQYQLYNKGPLLNVPDPSEITFNDYISTPSMRTIGSYYAYSWNYIPILSFFVNSAAYVWGGILLIAILLRKRDWKGSLMFVFPLINILICFASPVNGFVRYMMPVMACMPLLIWFGLRHHISPNPQIFDGNVQDDPSQLEDGGATK